MKKNFTMTAVALFMMVSCTSETTPVNNQSTSAVLLQKTITTDEEGEYISEYTYDGNKLTKISYSDGSYQNYTYTNEFITKIENYENNVLTDKETFEYNSNNQLVTSLSLSYDFEWGSKAVFTHNTDGTVSYEYFIGDLDTQTQLNNTGVLTLTNGNITQNIQTSSLGNVTTYNYTFDDKNSPYKNILAGNVLNMAYFEGGINNILSSDTNSDSYTVSYTYNDNDYPTESVETHDNDYTITIQYFYE